MSHSRLAFLGNAFLFLCGVHLGIAASFLLPSYTEYARDTRALGVDLHRILIGDRFTNVAATICLLHPIPFLCSLRAAHGIHPLDNLLPETAHGAQPSSTFPAAAGLGDCGCLSDALAGQHVFFGQLGYAIPATARIIDFLASSPIGSAVSRFERAGMKPQEGGEANADVIAVLSRVDAALRLARQAVAHVVNETGFALSRACFAHHAAFAALKIAGFVHNLVPFFDSVQDTDTTLRRLIEFLVSVMAASAETINMDAAVAVDALNKLSNAIAIDALDTLLRTYSSFTDRRQAISHCATTSSSSSPACSAAEMLLHNASMVEFMRDELVALQDTVRVLSKGFDTRLCLRASAMHVRCGFPATFNLRVLPRRVGTVVRHSTINPRSPLHVVYTLGS